MDAGHKAWAVILQKCDEIAAEGSQAAKEAWLAQADNPIPLFRRKYPSHAKVLDIAAQYGIRGRTKMPENELIAEILRLDPELISI